MKKKSTFSFAQLLAPSEEAIEAEAIEAIEASKVSLEGHVPNPDFTVTDLMQAARDLRDQDNEDQYEEKVVPSSWQPPSKELEQELDKLYTKWWALAKSLRHSDGNKNLILEKMDRINADILELDGDLP